MGNTLFEIIDDEDEADPSVKRVGRLSEMDTKEVSVVDRAANKRKFLVVKRDEGDVGAETGAGQQELPVVIKNTEEDAVGDTAVADTKDDATPETPVVNKKLVSVRIDEVLTRVQAVKGTFAQAEAKKGVGLPEVVSSELRSIQFMLKGMAGVTKGVALMVPGARDLEDCGEIETKVKKAGTKVLAEVETRLEALKADLGESEMLDATQAKKIDSAADMIAKVFHLTGGADTLVVMKGSLTDDQRDVVLLEIEKAMTGLGNLYVALQTDAVVKNAKIAMAPDVGDLLHSHAALIEKAVSAMFLGVENDRVVGQTAIEDVRKIIGSLGDESGVALDHLGGVVTEIAKAATMFQARWGSDKHAVVLATADEKVAEFDSHMEAEADALKRNIEAVSKVAKKFTSKVGGPKGFQVMDGEKAVGDFDTEEAAKLAANRMNFAGGGKTKKDEGDEVSGTETDDETVDTGKIGRPMKGDRLNRLKGAITMLKDAVGDLRAGSVSMEKFKKVADVLGSLISELQVGKNAAAAQTGGVADERGTASDSLNAGSGSHPGEGEGEISESPRLNEVLKRLEAVEGERGKDKKELAAARSEIRTLKKRRSAPSTPPADAVGAGVGEQQDAANSVAWPRDLNDL